MAGKRTRASGLSIKTGQNRFFIAGQNGPMESDPMENLVFEASTFAVCKETAKVNPRSGYLYQSRPDLYQLVRMACGLRERICYFFFSGGEYALRFWSRGEGVGAGFCSKEKTLRLAVGRKPFTKDVIRLKSCRHPE